VAKVRERERLRQLNESAVRAASLRSVERPRLAETRRAQLQRVRIERKMRRVASEAARQPQRSERWDDIVEASLVSARGVALDQRELVVDGLQKLLPPIKRRPVGTYSQR
jgi:hypothetical protein